MFPKKQYDGWNRYLHLQWRRRRAWTSTSWATRPASPPSSTSRETLISLHKVKFCIIFGGGPCPNRDPPHWMRCRAQPVLTADTVQAKGTDAAPSGWSWRDPDQRRPAPAFQPRHCEHQQGCRVVCVNNGAKSCGHVELDSKEAAWEDVTLQMMYISPNF